jgi:hypothetical protein
VVLNGITDVSFEFESFNSLPTSLKRYRFAHVIFGNGCVVQSPKFRLCGASLFVKISSPGNLRASPTSSSLPEVTVL